MANFEIEQNVGVERVAGKDENKLNLVELANAKPLLQQEKPSLAAGSSYGELLKEYPLQTSAATAGAALTAGYLGYRYLPGAAIGLAKSTPGLASLGAGAWGASKLVFSDAQDLLNADSGRDIAKYGLGSAADLTMVAGAVGRFVPGAKRLSLIATGAGIAGRAVVDYAFKEPEIPLAPKAQAETKHWSVDAPLTGGGSEKREYDAYLPKGYDGKEKLPVVMVLHGVAGGDAQGLMERETGLNAMADERRFIAVYPISKTRNVPYSLGMGKLQDWNSPGSGLTETKPGYDDVDYIKAVMSDLKQNKNLNIDENAQYVLGFSSGGAFANHLRGRMPKEFAGVGSVHGTLLGTEAKPQKNDGTAFVAIHSDSDQMVPLEGGRGLMTATFPKMSESLPLTQKEVAAEAVTAAIPKVSFDKHLKITEYAGPTFSKEYIIQGGSRGGMLGGILGRGKDGFSAQHAWDGPFEGGWPIVGDKNRAINVSKILLDDLLPHRRKDH